MKKLILFLAIMVSGIVAEPLTAIAAPVPQVCNYDRPCLYNGTVSAGLGYDLNISVYYSKDGKIVAQFVDKKGNTQVCYCFRTKADPQKWYFEWDGGTWYFKMKANI